MFDIVHLSALYGSEVGSLGELVSGKVELFI